MEVISSCPLFTEFHAQHSTVWSVPGYTLPTLCIACVIERLEKKGELTLHTQKILNELKALLTEGSQSKVLLVLKSDKRVLERLCGHLFGLLNSASTELAMEVLITITNLVQDSDVVLKLLHTTIHTVMKSLSFPSSLQHLTFLGKLLHSSLSLSNTVSKSYSHFLEFILGGLSYPDDSVKSSVVYVLVQVCSKSPPKSLGLPLVQNMCQYISTNLATAKSQELTVNLLGLVRHLLRSGAYTQCLIQADKLGSEAKGSTFASAFKRVLLSRDELLQLSAVQCVEEVLCHHMDYGKVLLTADIAEFLFEALSSKNELLIGSLFSCLNSLATVDDFYTKCHVLYGIEAVVNGLSASMRLRAHTAAQIGFNLLINILIKQPKGMQLFTAHSDLRKVLRVVLTALQVNLPALVLQATSLLHNLIRHTQMAVVLCSSHHIPPGLPMSTFLPILAVLLQLIEPLTTPTQAGAGTMGLASEHTTAGAITSDQKKQLGEVLLTFSKAYRYIEEISSVDRATVLADEDVTFFFKAYEESLLPAVLLNMDSLDDPNAFASLFNIATCHLSLSNACTADVFAKKLAHGAFISLVFEIKAKFLTTERYRELSSAGNKLLADMCYHLVKKTTSSSPNAAFVKDTLQTALPNMNCTAASCLHYLGQKAPSTLFHQMTSHVTSMSGHMTTGRSPIAVLQHATLLLLQCATSNNDIMVPFAEVLLSLHKYLSLNPNIHLLPHPILQCLAALFAETVNGVKGIQSEWIVDATQLLVHGLMKAPDPSHLCRPGDTTLLLWAFSQKQLQHTLARTWLLQWLRTATTNSDMSELVRVLEKSYHSIQCLLDLLTEVGSDIPLDAVLNVLEPLVSKECQLEARTGVVHSLQDAITRQRVDPIPEPSLVAILKLLTTALGCSGEGELVNLKLVFKVTGVVCRADMSSSDSINTAEQGMKLLSKILSTHSENIQIATLLLNNSSFLHKLGSFLSGITTPKSHNTVSASALHLMAHLVDTQLHLNINISQSSESVSLHLATPTTALLSPLASAQIAGLELWRVVFSREGKIGFLGLEGGLTNEHYDHSNLLRTVFYLVTNCLVNDNNTVRTAAALCVVEVGRHITKLQGKVSVSHHCIDTLMGHLVEMYHTSALPLLYVSPIATLLELIRNGSDCTHLIALSQLLYKSHLSLHSTESHTDTAAFNACFRKILTLDGNALTTAQQSTIDTS